MHIIITRSEMGQGVHQPAEDRCRRTRCRWITVRVVQAPGNDHVRIRTPTARAARATGSCRCGAAAPAPMMLEQAAAAKWGMPVAQVQARNHEVVHKATGRKLGYGTLALAAAKLEVPGARYAEAQGSEPVPLHRQVRHLPDRRQGHRQRNLAFRHRHPPARHALCRDRPPAGARRQGSQLRCGRDAEGAWRAQGVRTRRHTTRLPNSSQ